jgi:Rps23 Pro-64 3,4-dihydroxylase Tpa1-like proline 4-hydroxylase
MRILDHLANRYNTDTLKNHFNNASPTSMIVVDDFFPEDTAKVLSQELDSVDVTSCRKFTRNGSYMEEYNDLSTLPEAEEVVAQLHSQSFMKWLSASTGIDNLIPDPYLVGAGYSRSFRGDSLKNHVDFNWNDTLKLYRALTLIVYISEDWEEEWGGHLEFNEFQSKQTLNKILIKWNRAVIWKHHETCFHGYPTPITCPQDRSRKTLRVFYYVSNQEPQLDNPAHRSLYWFDQTSGIPVDNNSHE